MLPCQARPERAGRRLILLGAVLLLAAAAALLGHANGQTSDLPAVSKYLPGQVWSYRTRAQDQGSELVVVAVDQDAKLGTIIHVQVQGVFLQGPGAERGRTTTIGHMPFSADAMDRSVKELLRTAALPDFRDGYDNWRQAFDIGQAGVFSIAVAEAVDTVEQAMRP